MRRLLPWKSVVLLYLLAGCASAAAGAATTAGNWAEWDYFNSRFIDDGGRVVDIGSDRKTTSEGQSYALIFTLVANQRDRFDSILRWTSDHLAAGHLGEQLPAWLWGRKDDGGWGVKDPNSAADSDLWIAYDLLEAGRLWQVPAYTETGMQLLRQIRGHEVVDAGAAGTLLLPAPYGFVLDGGRRYRINPSYLPGFLFCYLSSADPSGPWNAIWNSTMRLLRAALVAGLAPDLLVADRDGTAEVDGDTHGVGSYDAIRVYLWAGLWSARSQPLIRALGRYAQLTDSLGMPPEKVDTLTGWPLRGNSGYSPIGFAGAMLPFLAARDDGPGLDLQLARLWPRQLQAVVGESSTYYDEVLILFGKGWLEGQYGFDRDGKLLTRWSH